MALPLPGSARLLGAPLHRFAAHSATGGPPCEWVIDTSIDMSRRADARRWRVRDAADPAETRAFPGGGALALLLRTPAAHPRRPREGGPAKGPSAGRERQSN